MRTLLLVSFDGAHGVGILGETLADRFRLQASSIDAKIPSVRIRSGQLSADDVLSEVCRLRLAQKAEYALGVTDSNLFVPDLNFVFGLASKDGACAVVSTSRLQGDGEAVFLERLVKEAVHELGHVFGLGHCDDRACVMHFSNSLRDTDYKGALFCGECSSLLEP